MVLSKTWRLTLLLCVCGVTALKIFLALGSSGTLDVFAFGEFLANIREAGGIGAYYRTGRAGNPFNHPPFMVHAIRSMGFLADATHLPFRFWLRLPSIVADLGNLFLVWKLVEHTTSLRQSAAVRVWPLSLVLLAVYPGSILISGFHGNTDPLMIFFVVLSIYLLTVRRLPWLAGAAFGMALNIKIVPLVFAPAIFLFLPDLPTRLKFFVTAATVFFVGSLPYLLQDPFVIWKTVFGYKSLYGRWGWTRLVVKYVPGLAPPSVGNLELVGGHALIASAGRFVMLASIVAASFWMNLRRHKPPLFVQCALVAFLFLFLTPGFGTQYLAWPVPWLVVLGAWSACAYYLASACYIVSIYWSVSTAARRVLDLPGLVPGNFYFILELACWLSILFALVSCWRLLRNYRDAAETPAERGAG
ncbi:MAG TPA: glycosyltransferase 87 family protein [Pyrinomonadaceae bacterium]